MDSEQGGPREPAGDESGPATGRGRAPERVAEIRARTRGCLLGGALGDALGAPIEFMPWPMIRSLYGERGLATLEPAYGRAGAITDDTQMTLFTAEGLIRASVRGKSRGSGDPPAVVLHAYRRWLYTQGIPWAEAAGDPRGGLRGPDGWLVRQRFLHARRAPGNTCLGALAHGGGERAATNDSKGCGGVMRSAPVGLLAGPGTGGEPTAREGLFRLAVECAALTHGHPSGQLPAGVLAATLHAIVHEGQPLARALDLATAVLRGQRHHEETLAALAAARDLAGRGAPSPEKVHTLGGGWVAEEALAIAVYAALSCPGDLRAALVLAVNHSGDSDSTGALCGNLLGAALGQEALPADWLGRLEGRDVIRRLADDLVDEVCDLRPQEDGPAREGPGSYSAWLQRYPGW